MGSRTLYLRSQTWRMLLDSFKPEDYSISGMLSGILASLNPGLSEILAGMTTSYELGEGLLGDNPLHELLWFLPYYMVAAVLSLSLRRLYFSRLEAHG